MLIDCPHCYTRVIAKSDGSCPACGRDTQDREGRDTSWASIRVSQGDLLPPICCECGRPTPRIASVLQKNRQGEEPSWPMGVGIVSMLSWLLGLWLMAHRITNTTLVEVKMPQCESCGRRGPPEPRYVDFGNARMTFVVHKSLKDAMTA